MRGRETFGAWVLAAMPGIESQIAIRSGVCRSSTNVWLKALCRSGAAHVSDWEASPKGGSPAAIYSAGPGINAICKIKKLTPTQIYRRKVARIKKDGRYEILLSKKKDYRLKKKAQRLGDPLVNALFGRSA